MPGGTNPKIPASQPTQRGREMMALEREMWLQLNTANFDKHTNKFRNMSKKKMEDRTQWQVKDRQARRK